MTYTLYSNGVLEQDGFYLPIDELNPDYIEYQQWIAQGNTPTLRPASEYLAKVEDRKADRQQIRAEFMDTIAQLQNIQDAVSPTNTQVIAGIKFLAKTLKLILKFMARNI